MKSNKNSKYNYKIAINIPNIDQSTVSMQLYYLDTYKPKDIMSLSSMIIARELRGGWHFSKQNKINFFNPELNSFEFVQGGFYPNYKNVDFLIFPCEAHREMYKCILDQYTYDTIMDSFKPLATWTGISEDFEKKNFSIFGYYIGEEPKYWLIIDA